MEKRATYVDDHDPVSVTTIGDDHALMDLKGRRIVLTYDAAYDLALRLGRWLQQTSAGSDVIMN